MFEVIRIVGMKEKKSTNNSRNRYQKVRTSSGVI